MADRFTSTAAIVVREVLEQKLDRTNLKMTEGSGTTRNVQHLIEIANAVIRHSDSTTDFSMHFQDENQADLVLSFNILKFEYHRLTGDVGKQIEIGNELASMLGETLPTSRLNCVATLCAMAQFVNPQNRDCCALKCRSVVDCTEASPELVYWGYANLIQIELIKEVSSNHDGAIISNLRINNSRNIIIESLYEEMLFASSLKTFHIDILFRKASYLQHCGMHEFAAAIYLEIAETPGFVDQASNHILFCEAIAGRVDALTMCGKLIMAAKEASKLDNLVCEYNANSLFLSIKTRKQDWLTRILSLIKR